MINQRDPIPTCVQSNGVLTGAAYIRVSTDGQMDLSPESQLDEILKYAETHGIRLPDEYIFMESEGRSGKKADNRPEFQRMIATAKTVPKPFDCILVWKFSRFARNQDESTFYKGMLRKKLDIDVISISEPVLDGMYGRLIEMIIEWQDEFYSYNLAQDVFRGMKKKALNGGSQSRPPLGYRIPYHNAGPEIVPEEAAVIRLIFNQYVNEKKSIYAITRFLNSQGMKTGQGNPFEKRSVEYILQNPVYAGIIRWNRTCGETHSIKDPSQWIVSKGIHPPIISEELYNKAMLRYTHDTRRKNSQPAEAGKHWLSGLLKCSCCGRSLSACIRHRKTCDCYTFQCYGYLKGKCSHNSYVSESSVAPAVLKSLNEILENSTVTYELTRSKEKSENLQLDLLNQALARLPLKEKRARDAYMDGIDTKEEYRQNKRTLQSEREQLLRSISQLQNAQVQLHCETAPPQNPEQIHNIIDILQSDRFSMQQKNRALKSIVDKIIVDRDKMHIDIYYHLYR
ncbi:recombinase family protein [Clostridium sp. chh4-2]|uniref:recombinase family protein n=1 Tax=Clostridium sp. chh4-2 TaxID=2067550 RepID=UPI000CCE0F98|nr:recombinase family protein [Clostridium sp. chh4-2]PNV61060.1 recombinase family protein [Clostridium sp. chh4-2]